MRVCRSTESIPSKKCDVRPRNHTLCFGRRRRSSIDVDWALPMATVVCVLTGYEDEAREHGTRAGQKNDKGGPHSLSQCGCRPGLRWSVMQGVWPLQ